MKKITLLIFVVSMLTVTISQSSFAGIYAPAAGQTGSTAIHFDDPLFVGWADGYTNYVVGENVDTVWQTPDNALGMAVDDGYTDMVTLGRGGEITLTFSTPIIDGPGWDFATFENSLNDTFLELGYVEVSSNGISFFRFDNYSNTSDPVSSYGAVAPTNITGYCSKYRQGYGTPFDLNDLAGTAGLDITAITHIKIIDIIGDGNYFDSNGNAIYDPCPTYNSAGLDIDAIGVIHQVPEPATLLLIAAGIPVLLKRRQKTGV